METIRNYLESMFAGLPNTAEVIKAKDELQQMMEDKYNELISEGKNENEAVGTVIAQFGNLDDLSETLGISEQMRAEEKTGKFMTLAQVRDYIGENVQVAFMRALGTFFFITCPASLVMSSMIGTTRYINMNSSMAVGLIIFFIFVALGVGMFVISSVKANSWNYITEEGYSIDYKTAEILKEQKDAYKVSYSLLLTVGIILIIISVVPICVFSLLGTGSSNILMAVGEALIHVFVGIGVMMIMMANGKNNSYRTLLSLNDNDTVSSKYAGSEERVNYSNKNLKAFMKAYSQIVLCIYLIWSFLTFDWYITWIIFPVSAVIKSLIRSVWGSDEKGGKN